MHWPLGPAASSYLHEKKSVKITKPSSKPDADLKNPKFLPNFLTIFKKLFVNFTKLFVNFTKLFVNFIKLFVKIAKGLVKILDFQICLRIT